MATPPQAPTLARRLGLADATLIVMGGIIGSGIFMNPYVVARHLRSPWLILGAWLAGGVIALVGAFLYSELASRRPAVGGQYAYLREAFHPALAFLYGWCLLLVVQTGGMAAVAVTFARYFRELSGLALSDALLASLALGALTLINCFGVRSGGTVQNLLMVLKLGALAALIGTGLWIAAPLGTPASPRVGPPEIGLFTAFGAALIPVLFSYGGWQTASFLAGEMRDPRRDLPRGLLLGVGGVVLLYVLVNVVCLRVLGVDGLAATTTPASDVMRAAFGESGARWIAAGIAVSTLGFLAQSMLTAPRVYFAMAQDRLFFERVGWLHPKTRVPVVAVVLQGLCAMVIALTGRYEQILNYVVSVDWIFFALAAASLFALRRRDRQNGEMSFRASGHPWTTVLFVLVCVLVVLNTVREAPAQSGIGLAILASGLPVYALWRRRGAA